MWQAGVCSGGGAGYPLAEQIINNLLGRQVDANYVVRMYCIRGLGNMASMLPPLNNKGLHQRYTGEGEGLCVWGEVCACVGVGRVCGVGGRCVCGREGVCGSEVWGRCVFGEGACVWGGGVCWEEGVCVCGGRCVRVGVCVGGVGVCGCALGILCV